MTDILVLGAGMVGVATALALQADGHSVTILDRAAPGQGASYGNAGIIQVEAVEPYALPRAPATLLRFALKRDNAVNYHLSALPGAAWPLWSYFLNSAPARHRQISAAYRRIIQRSGQDHDRLITAAGAEALIRRTGFLQVYRDGFGFDEGREEAGRLRDDYGVALRILDPRTLRQEEPALQRDFAGAIHWTDSRTCRDPGALVQAYAAFFEQNGGRIERGTIVGLARSGAGWRIALAEGGAFEAGQVVVALGADTPGLLAGIGLHIPMVRKRGYHRHYQSAEPPQKPIFDVGASVLYCPMAAGVRITSGAEIARPGAGLTPVQLARGESAAQEVLKLGAPVEAEPWAGWRPCMPDMLPVIGALPGQKGLWANFGHGHQGFTLGPTTGLVLADLIAGRAPFCDPLPYSAARFG